MYRYGVCVETGMPLSVVDHCLIASKTAQIGLKFGWEANQHIYCFRVFGTFGTGRRPHLFSKPTFNFKLSTLVS